MLINPTIAKQEAKTKRELEWNEVENLVTTYQKRFTETAPDILRASELAAEELIIRFQPLFTKYLRVIKKCEINFFDAETKSFVFTFIDKNTRALFPTNKKDIVHKFKFIVKTYGMLDDSEIISDMQEIFMKLLKRYKQVGRSFCGYLYNVFFHEMSRWVKKYIANPINIGYNVAGYNELNSDFETIEDLIIQIHNKKEILDNEWLKGVDCEDVFQHLDIIDRKILMEYYINDQNDKQISDNLGIHINTVNQRRRKALGKLLDAMPNNNALKIIRSRKVGFQIN